MLLNELQLPYQSMLTAVDRRMAEALAGSDDHLHQLLEASPISGGKKVRSTLFFMMLGETASDKPEAIDLAAAMEMLHQASLVHDDVLDHAQTRRDKPALHQLVDNTLAVLVGDYLFIKALSLVHGLERTRLMGIKLAVTEELIYGQIDDMQPRHHDRPTHDRYLEILEKKTGALFGAAAEMAAILQGADEVQIAVSRQFGRSFGVLFQLQDDVLDLFSTKTGKDRWGDLREGKWTLPSLLLSEARPDIRLFPFDEKRIPEIEAGLRQHDIAARCWSVLSRYRARTEDRLVDLHEHVRQAELRDLIEYVCRRER